MEGCNWGPLRIYSVIEFLTNYSITHWSCCRNSRPLWNPPHPGLQGLEKSLVLHIEFKFLSFFFFYSSHESFRLQWRHGNFCKAVHHFNCVYVFRAEKRERSLTRTQKMKEDEKKTSIGTSDEVQKPQKYIPTFLRGQMWLWSLREKSDTDGAGKGSVCDKHRDLNWGKKNHFRWQKTPSQTFLKWKLQSLTDPENILDPNGEKIWNSRIF